MRQEARLERFVRGWNPHNLPPTYLNPRELGEGQVLDARGVRFTPGGSLFWDRNQLRIQKPSGGDIGETKSLVQFRTDEYNQLLAFVKYGAGAPYSGKAYVLTTDWTTATPSQWTYGYELFSAGSWTEITTDALAVAELASTGIAAAVQARDALIISVAKGTALLLWDGVKLRIIGLDAPPAAPTSGGTASGVLPAGTYSYYYSYYDPDSGFESMPSPVLDEHVTVAGKKIVVQGITDYGDAHFKRLYRAYVEDSGEDARGADFYLVTTLSPGSADGVAEDLTTWTEVDTEERLTVAANQLDAAALEEDDTCYLYKDEGADNIGDFEWRFSLNISSIDSGATVVPFGVTNTLATWASWADGFAVWAYYDGVYHAFRLKGGGAQTDVCLFEIDTTYYLKLRRSGDRVYLEVYTTSDYSGEPLGSGSIAEATTTYRYVMASCALGGAGTEAVTLRITDVKQVATTFTDNTPEYALGEALAFDHALPPRGEILTWHKERMFIAGSDEGSRSYPGYDAGYWGNTLFFSELDEPYYWPGDNIIVVGDDAPITGLASWGDYLVVFKQSSVWAVTGWGADQFRVTQVAGAPGAIAARAQAAAPPGVLWMSADGYYFWDGATLRQLVEFSDETPWAVLSAGKAAQVCYHDGRFYILQASGWLTWEPATDQFCYQEADFTDADSARLGLCAYAQGGRQTHMLTRMIWASAGSQEITVLDPAWKWTGHASEGSSYSELFAPVAITLPPLDAPPGYLIQPLELWVSGTWVDHAEATKHVKAHLNADAGYSAVAGANAWATTPDAPQEGEVLGVPLSYEYGAASTCTNAARRWYIQLKGDYAKDLRLEAVTVRYLLRRAPGA